MPDLQLVPEDNQRADMDIGGLVLRNMFYAGTGGVANGPAFLPVPGLFERSSFGAPPCRGLHYVQGGPDTKINKQVGNTLYAVYGGSLYGVNENSKVSRIASGIVNETGDPVRMASTRDQLCIVSEKKAYIWNGSSLTLISPSWVDADTPFEPSDVCAAGGRFVWSMARNVREESDGSLTVVEKGDRLRWAEIEDGTDIDVLDFITAATMADEIIAIVQDRREVVIIGADTIEFARQTGNAQAAFAIDGNMVMPIGALSRDSVIKADNTIYFVDRQFRVVRLSGSSFEVISRNKSISARLDNVSKSKHDEITMWGATYMGHPFVGVDIPGDACMVFDAEAQVWHERKSWNDDTGLPRDWRANFVQEAFGRIWVGGKDTGKLWTFEQRSDSEGGEVLERIVTAFIPVSERAYRLRNICLYLRTGLMGQTEGEQECMMRYKEPDDTWSEWRHASMGERGQRFNKAVWWTGGLIEGKDLEVQFRCTDPTPFIIDKATFNEARP